MIDIWNKFKSIEDKEVVEIEKEWRDTNPTLYDAGLAIYPFDEPSFIKKLISENQISPNDRMVKTDKPFLFSAIVENRFETTKILIEAGAEMTYLSMNKDYLFWALYGNCDLKLITLLLDKGRFDLNPSSLLLLIEKCDEDTIYAFIEGRNLDVIIDDTSLFEEAIRHNLYAIAKIILNADCPKTLKRLKDNNYLDVLNSKINNAPINFDFSSKKRPRKKALYSKQSLIEIRQLLKLKNIG